MPEIAANEMRGQQAPPSETQLQRAARPLERAVEGYGGGEEMPLGGYATLLGLYWVTASGLMAAAKNRGRELPEEIDLKDLVLMGVATHKLSRLITKDWVTSPLRAPFTEYKGSAGAGEVSEKSRGRGLRRAVGDLLTCPWCTGAWVSMFMGFGYVLSPRLTRLTSLIFSTEAICDFLHLGYGAAKKLE